MYVRRQPGLVCLWLCLLALAPFQVAHAQSTATGTQYWAKACIGTAEFSPAHASAQNACNQTAAQCMGYTSGGTSYSGTVTGLSCTIKIFNSSGAQIPAGDQTYTIRTSQGPISLGCPSAGDVRTINMTLGYTHDPSGDKTASVNTYADKYSSMRDAGSMCASGGGSSCAVSFGSTPPSMVWISASPNAQGLYRISVDQKVTYTGASCTQTANEKMVTESTDAAPACDGTYGVVNGKAVCVPSNSGSRNLVQSQTGTSATPRQVGNPAAGSNGGLPIASRTPSGGTGSNDGGPVTPLDGSAAPLGSPLPTTPVNKVTADVNVPTDCDKHPESAGCASFGAPSSDALHSTTQAVSVVAATFASASGCPAPLSFTVATHTYSFSYQPLCDRLFLLKVLFLAIAGVLAAYILADSFRVQ